MSAHSHSGRVYFIALGAYVKIGYTSQHIVHRLHSLRRPSRLTCPADMDFSQRPQILRLIPGCIIRDEHRVQVLFGAHHAIGEWYHLTPAFLRQLQRFDYVTDREVLANFRDQRRLLKRMAARRAAA